MNQRCNVIVGCLLAVLVGCGDDSDSASDASADARTDGTVSGGGNDASSSSDATGGSAGTYAALATAGAVPRMIISRSDPARNLCFQIVLWPTPGGMSQIDLPRAWYLEQAGASPSALPCSARPALGGFVAATGGTGKINFDARECQLDVDVTLAFAMPAKGGAPSEQLVAKKLAVTDCVPLK